MAGRLAETAGLSGVVKPIRCPYPDECGYEGVWLREDLFKQHLEKFHKGKANRFNVLS